MVSRVGVGLVVSGVIWVAFGYGRVPDLAAEHILMGVAIIFFGLCLMILGEGAPRP